MIVDKKVQIVDEFTGRVMPDRSWERGLHQLIESKERSVTSDQKRTMAQITYQQFFCRYLWLSGMTGTASEVSRELAAVYDLKVVQIPTHRPVRRKNLGTRVFRTAEEKWRAVIAATAQAHAKGRPVLIGTRSVAASQTVSEHCVRAGLDHIVLNALQDFHEAEIIANAGNRGRITVATNMAGRGTDIRLGRDVAAAGGMHIILTEFHESLRIDRQLFGRSARQGDPGTYEAIVSLEDELFQRFGNLLIRIYQGLFLHQHTAVPSWMGVAARSAAQGGAETFNRKMRRETMRRQALLEKALVVAGLYRMIPP